MKASSSNKIEKWHLYYRNGTVGMLGISLLLVIVAVGLVKMMGSAPGALIVFATYYLYAHLAWFGLGIAFLIQWLVRPVLRQSGVRIGKVIVGILGSPISAVITYAAILLLALSSCSG